MNWLDGAEVVEVKFDTDMRKIVPFEGTEMLGYQEGWREVVWYKFQEFEATLKFDKVSKGRSSVKFHFIDEYGTKYEMFKKDAPDFINNAAGGELTGRWGFVKRGANYGIQDLS